MMMRCYWVMWISEEDRRIIISFIRWKQLLFVHLKTVLVSQVPLFNSLSWSIRVKVNRLWILRLFRRIILTLISTMKVKIIITKCNNQVQLSRASLQRILSPKVITDLVSRKEEWWNSSWMPLIKELQCMLSPVHLPQRDVDYSLFNSYFPF